MNLIVLCAGYATRLYPLTKDHPKPLLPIDGRPIIEYILEKFLGKDHFKNIYIITNQKFYSAFQDWSKQYDCSIPIEVVNDHTTSDDDKLGAIGDMAYIIKEKNITGETVVIAGDNLFDFSLDLFFKNARDQGVHAGIAAFDVQDRELAKKYGIVKINDAHRVVSFIEKPADPPSTFASLGVYFFSAEGVSLIAKYLAGGGNPDQPGNYIKWLTDHYSVFGAVFLGTWFDIGDIDSYEKANMCFKKLHKQTRKENE